jgi:hypothetical protein
MATKSSSPFSESCTVAPQSGQKLKVKVQPSSPTRTNCLDSPLMTTLWMPNLACAEKTLPVRRWQARQWQTAMPMGLHRCTEEVGVQLDDLDLKNVVDDCPPGCTVIIVPGSRSFPCPSLAERVPRDSSTGVTTAPPASGVYLVPMRGTNVGA